jgi:hypothetical protein
MRFPRYHFAAAALLALPLAAQMASRAVPAAAPPAAGGTLQAPGAAKVSVSALYAIERAADDRLRGIGEPNTVDILGATRGIYLDGYGAVFTAEVGLVTPPAIYPFHPTITPQEKAGVHQKKVQRLPVLKTTMREILRAAAASLSGVPDSQQIVLAVRLDYMKWEDTSGLPAMIMLKADRKSALSGTVQAEEQ